MTILNYVRKFFSYLIVFNKRVIWFLFKIGNFISAFFLYFVDVFLTYYEVINKDIEKFSKTVQWTKNFFIGRFTDWSLLGIFAAMWTIWAIFTVYPIMLLLTILATIGEAIIKYSFLPLDILFKNFLLTVDLSPGNKLTLKGLYSLVLVLKDNVNRINLFIRFFLGYFDKIYWANRFIRRWNKIDDFLYRMAIGIEIYIYWQVRCWWIIYCFFNKVRKLVAFYIFRKNGRKSLRRRIKVYYIIWKSYVFKLLHWCLFVFKWRFYVFLQFIVRMINYFPFILSLIFWSIIALLWEIIETFLIGLILILRIHIFLFLEFKEWFLFKRAQYLSKRLMKINNRHEKERIKAKDKII